jgi:hypothetical protein
MAIEMIEQPTVIAVVHPSTFNSDSASVPFYGMPYSDIIASEILDPFLITSSSLGEEIALAHNNMLMKYFLPQITHFIDTMLVPNQPLSYKTLNRIMNSAFLQFGFK